ncbi:protein LUTEIN DEFICIENT 5, chloroplastic-like [Rutidosis leptorrhynchoides]|uniref:protein LUTEIN DEFICIENT 5, chloroplastic-like n=1 Tax=Rutidosis leptorrhynchoides TaxID=125765 RepID=UPI003A998141
MGEDLFISVWNLHHSPTPWVDADKFNPERWPLDGPNSNETNQNFSYLPFGDGPKKCVGDMFASFEAIVAVSMLVCRYKFQMALGAPLEVTLSLFSIILFYRIKSKNVTNSSFHIKTYYGLEKQFG